MCVRVCIFILLGVVSLSLNLLRPFEFDQGGVVGVCGVIMTCLNCGKHLGALYGISFSP